MGGRGGGEELYNQSSKKKILDSFKTRSFKFFGTFLVWKINYLERELGKNKFLCNNETRIKNKK